MDHSDLDRLSDEELLERLELLAKAERENLPHLLACLAAVDDRGAHRKPGYPSLFEYCTKRLRYSEDEAYRRIHASRAATRFGEIYSMLADGSLSLTAASRLAPYLTPANAAELLAQSQNKTIRAIEELLAGRFPKPDTADRIRVLKTAPITPPRPGSEKPKPSDDQDSDQAAPDATASSSPTGRDGLSPEPIRSPERSEGRFEFSFTGSRALREAIERLKDVLWHKHPWGRLEDILLEALNDYLERHDPQILLIERGRPAGVRPSSKRTVPAWVRRAVWSRDKGRCAYVAPDGRRCETRRGLEWDHIRPFSRGGRSDDPKNIRLLCRAHNDLERRRVLGG